VHSSGVREFAKSLSGISEIRTLIVSAKLNDIDPQVWLADVLARIADMPQNRLGELLPWNWNANKDAVKLVA